MCRLMLCPNCTRYRTYGCNDPEHEALTMGALEESKRCQCKAQQMAEVRARAEEKARVDEARARALGNPRHQAMLAEMAARKGSQRPR